MQKQTVKSPSPHIMKMRAIAEDLIGFNKKKKDLTHKQALAGFYRIMAKHGIKQGTWSKNGSGRHCNNPEWTMCIELFLSNHRSNQDFAAMFSQPPAPLLAYGKKPKVRI